LFSERILAVILVILSTFGFAIQDMVVKLLSEIGSLWQLMLLRAVLVVFILIAWVMLRRRPDIIQPAGWKWPVFRAFLMSCAYSFFYASLPFTALAQAAACFFTAPIFTCLFAAVILKEKVGIWRISSMLIGFLGVLYIIQPGTSNMQLILFLPVVAGASYALGVVITRGFCRDQPALSLTIIHNVFYALVGAVMVTFIPIIPIPVDMKVTNSFVFSGWLELTFSIVIMIGITSLTHILAMTSSIRAYQLADSSFVSLFEYTYLIFAILIDFIVWQYIPNTEGFIGVTMIISAGVVIALRERSRTTTAEQSKT
tara:strand:+ start:279 stop:1217 length:939 start_codon:yes stop_codon:yes gene_type:complete